MLGFIVALLENLGLFIDPFRVISRIPNGLEIPKLKPALIQVLRDLTTQISLREGCREILLGDTTELLEMLHKFQSKGFLVEGNTASTYVTAFPLCSICNRHITQNGMYI